MIDFHSHVLPGIDDGSKSVEESLKMLVASAGQGITQMAATSHFYPSETSLEQFLSCRERAVDQLLAVWRSEFPELLLGAEVYYFEGISQADGLEALRMEGTSLLLLEMPFHAWSGRVVAEVKALHNRPGFTVLLAHIERYLRFQRDAVWDELREAGVLMQSNAEFFLSWKTKRKACQMLRDGKIHFLGSDSHNMAERPPRLGKAMAAIGEMGRQRLEWNIQNLLPVTEGIVH